MPQLQRLSKNNTIVKRTHDAKIIVRLYATDIVTIDYLHKKVTFNTGGWVTLTTATRINQACNQYGLPFYVSRKDGALIVCDKVQNIKHTMDTNVLTLSF